MSSYHNYFNNQNHIDKGNKNRPKDGLDFNYLKSNDSNEEKKPKNRKLSDYYNQIMDNNNRKDIEDGPKDKINPKNEKEKKTNEAQKKDDTEKIINDYYNEILRHKESKLLTDSQYVSLENKIGENSCYVNVIIHFLYIFPCVNDYLIRKYTKKLEKDLKEKQEKEKAKQANENQQNNGEKDNNEKKEDNNHKEIKAQKQNNEQKENNEIKEKNDKNEKKPVIIKEKGSDSNNKIIINDKAQVEKEAKKPKKTKKKDINDFLYNLGKLLNDYQKILSTIDDNKSNNKITKLTTNQLRKSLSIASDNLFKLNNISDPIEFLIYILDLINIENLEEIHLYFHLILIEEIRCTNFCPCKSNKKYDKDNYIYQIYVEDIFNYIKKHKLDFDEYRERLFMLSFYSLQNEIIKCEKCKSTMNKTLICNNKSGSPKFLLINCVWNNAKPEIENVVSFLYLISLIEEIDNLFLCPNKAEKDHYYLMGIIFYSFTLCHYINMIFNIQKNVFTLYNDESILEFTNINEVYRYITIEQIKNNNKAYFYPVLLVYGKENIYDENMLPKIKRNNETNYDMLILECKNEIKKNSSSKEEQPLTEEQKQKNYRELIEAQIKYEKEQELQNLLNRNQTKLSSDYYRRLIEESDNRKLNINNTQNKNNFLRGNTNKTRAASSDKNNYNFYNSISPNPISENDRIKNARLGAHIPYNKYGYNNYKF